MSEQKNKKYYKQCYINKMHNISKELLEDTSREFDLAYEATVRFEETATVDEVVGYYLFFTDENQRPLDMWLQGSESSYLQADNEKVGEILRRLDKEDKGYKKWKDWENQK